MPKSKPEKESECELQKVFKKDVSGFYNREDIYLLDPVDIINVLIDETSCQDTMNLVRQNVFSLFEN